MITFEQISIRNFLSYGNAPTIINLNQKKSILIVGENGAGKTSVVNALVFALYGKPISDISKDNLVNHINKSNLEVIVTFTIKKDKYKVRRVRKEKSGAAGNYVELEKNGEDITRGSTNEVNKDIERILRIPYELFVRIITFTATHKPFLELPASSHYQANQTDIIEELFDLKTLSEKAETLKGKIKDAKIKFNQHKALMAHQEREHQRHRDQIRGARERVVNWQLQNDNEIQTIQTKLDKIDNVDLDKQHQLREQTDVLEKQLSDDAHIHADLDKKVKQLTKKQKSKTDEIEHLTNDKCPYCHQEYAESQEKLDLCTKELITLERELIDNSERLSKLADSLIDLAAQRDDIVEQITVSDLNELIEVKGKIGKYQQRLKDLKGTDNPFIEPLEELNEIELDNIDHKQANDLQELLDHQDFLLKLLTKKDSFVRKRLLDKNIPFLNQRLSTYLRHLGLPHNMEFTHKMAAQITQFGRELDFGNLSNGQRARVNIALSFAFRDVLQKLHGHINVCLLDEVLDVGLDTMGVQDAAKMIKQRARDEGSTLIIISHKVEVDGSFDKKMHITLDNGFSVITED